MSNDKVEYVFRPKNKPPVDAYKSCKNCINWIDRCITSTTICDMYECKFTLLEGGKKK